MNSNGNGGYENASDTVICSVQRDDQRINLDIRDTAGMERYRSLTKSHYHGASGALILFDLTDEKSFNNVIHWMDDLSRYSDCTVQTLIVGTRCHRPDQRAVSADRLATFTENFDVASIEVSVEEGTNVMQAFDLLLDRILEARPQLLHGEQPCFQSVPRLTELEPENDLYTNCSQCCPLGNKPKQTAGVR
ncbi:ras-related protein Rab-3A-like [Diadema antillarum]|uniref:ras-related protein Rab-3A-like n=1 Tax=Diadema antillarum TaxID=105358 RepID=UPI003A83B0BC